jgi:Ca2+-binding RTX toxin-like protein
VRIVVAVICGGRIEFDDAVITSFISSIDVGQAYAYKVNLMYDWSATTGAGDFNGYGMENDDTLTGKEGNDTLTGNKGNDTLTGGTGNDTYIFARGDGNDLINNFDDSNSTDTLKLGQGITRNDLTFFRESNDLLVVIANVEGASDSVRISNHFLINPDNANSPQYNLEQITLADGSTIDLATIVYIIRGTAANNTPTDEAYYFKGDNNNNILQGLAGNDELDGGLGADTMEGGAGDDIYLVDDIGDQTIELANQGIDTVKSPFSYTLLDNVENLILTGTNHSTATGNALNNTLTGNEGNNLLLGMAGNDVLNGMSGNDSLNGGDNEDLLDGMDGDDLLNGDNGNDTLKGGLGADILIGGAGNDLLSGMDGNDQLSGEAGNDNLNGGTGDDVLTGGAGDDTVEGGAGNDVYRF